MWGALRHLELAPSIYTLSLPLYAYVKIVRNKLTRKYLSIYLSIYPHMLYSNLSIYLPPNVILIFIYFLIYFYLSIYLSYLIGLYISDIIFAFTPLSPSLALPTLWPCPSHPNIYHAVGQLLLLSAVASRSHT